MAIQLSSTLYPAAPCWYPEGVAAETTVKSGETKQRKKRAEPFAQFSEAGRMDGGGRRTDDVKPAGWLNSRASQQAEGYHGRR